MRRTGAHRGYALLTSLAFLTVLAVLSYSFQTSMQLEATYTRAALWSEQARTLAAGGVAEAEAALATGADPAVLAAPHEFGGGLVVVRVEPASARLHLNRAPVAEVAALLGVDETAVARARPFASVHDTVAALGLSPAQYATVRAHTTVYGNGRLDLTRAPEAVVRVVGGLAPAQVDALLRQRAGPDGQAGTADDVALASVDSLAAVSGLARDAAARLAERLGADPAWYHVTAEARVVAEGRTRRTARVEAVLHQSAAGWTPVSWIEETTSAS